MDSLGFNSWQGHPGVRNAHRSTKGHRIQALRAVQTPTELGKGLQGP